MKHNKFIHCFSPHLCCARYVLVETGQRLLLCIRILLSLELRLTRFCLCL